MRAKEEGFYHRKPWRRIRKKALQRDRYLCQYCLREGKVVRATEVHHIIEADKDEDLRLSLDNLISLCWNCHEKTKKKGKKSIPEGVRIVRIVDGEKDADLSPLHKK